MTEFQCPHCAERIKVFEIGETGGTRESKCLISLSLPPGLKSGPASEIETDF
jgi:hypothetical protein